MRQENFLASMKIHGVFQSWRIIISVSTDCVHLYFQASSLLLSVFRPVRVGSGRKPKLLVFSPEGSNGITPGRKLFINTSIGYQNTYDCNGTKAELCIIVNFWSL